MQLKKGDPCRVRLHTGEVVEAVYYGHCHNKSHFVIANGKDYCADRRPKKCLITMDDCRFVGPACVLVPVGVSV